MVKEPKHCSFCGIEASVSVPMIAGTEGLICEACVTLASQVVSSWGKKKAMAEMEMALPKPMEIKSLLDQYVIGQPLAKEILAVIEIHKSISSLFPQPVCRTKNFYKVRFITRFPKIVITGQGNVLNSGLIHYLF